MTDAPRRVEPWPGAATLSKRIPYGWFTRRMAGEQIGRTEDRIKAWEKDGTCWPDSNKRVAPDGYIEAGALTIPLYSVEAVERLRVVAANKKPGPRKKDEDG